MRRTEDESSLELLLDTMCNTFGGVMFIAITLAVGLFTRNAVENRQPPEERLSRRRETIVAEIEAMKKVLEQEGRRTREMAETYQTLEKDPRLKSLKQLALLEEMVQNASKKLQLQERENSVIDKEILQQDAQRQRLLAQTQTMEREIQTLTDKIDEKKDIIQNMTVELQKMSPLNIMFTVLETHDDRMSYFMLLKGGKLWRVGPGDQRDQDGIQKPLDDVTYSYDGKKVICFPKDDAGMEVLAGNALSPQCLQCFMDVPKNRGAVICFAKEDAETFYKMRELLKKHRIFHGFSIQQTSDFTGYVLVEETHYEY